MSGARFLGGVGFTVAMACAVAGAAWFGYYSIFSTFSFWDDEGFFMISYKVFNDGGALYDEVFTLYGPFPYLYQFVVHWGRAVSHDLTREITLVHWMMVALGCSLFVYRLSRSKLLSVVVFLECAVLLRELIHEPGHPQGLCLVLIVVALHLSIPVRGVGWGRLQACGLGAVAALLALTKINLGVYMALALAVTMLVPGDRSRWTRAAAGVAGSLCIAIPFVLMRQHLGLGWAARYALFTALAAAALVTATFGGRVTAGFRQRERFLVVAGCLGTMVFVCTIVVMRGTSIMGLLEGSLLRILSFGSVFCLPADLSRWSVAAAGVSLAIAAVYGMAHRGLLGEAGRLRVASLILWLKVALIAGVLYSVHGDPGVLLGIFAPFAWLLLAPGRREEKVTGSERPRLFLAACSVMMMLWGYPVYGSQASWSVILVIPALAVSGWDGFSELQRRLPAVGSVPFRSAISALAVVSAVVAYIGPGPLAVTDEKTRYDSLAPLGLKGASRVRLEPHVADLFRRLVRALQLQADLFVTMPGLNSLYFWTEQDPPTGFNTTTWMVLLTDEEQEQIIERMGGEQRVLVLANPAISSFWTQGREISNRPLVRFITENFSPVSQVEGFVFLERAAESNSAARR